jgi:L-amino acid N-acyltransferase YncA
MICTGQSVVREATSDDAIKIAEIWNPIISDTPFTFTNIRKTPENLAKDIDGKNGAFFVACQNEDIVGFATYGAFRNGPGYAYTKEHSIILAPHAHGKGIGRALMSALEAHAAATGVHSMWAGVSAENPAAICFHAALGYTEVARLPEVGFKFNRWIDLVLMQKVLTQRSV